MTELDFTPRDLSPTCRRFALANAFVRDIMGPVGSGKSTACNREIARRSLRQKRSPDGVRRTRWAVIRNSYRELEDTTRKTFEQWIPGRLGRWRESDFAFDISIEDVQAEVLFRALDRPDDVRKLLSLELTGAYINEAKEVPKAVFDILKTRVGRYPAMKDGGATWSGIWMDTNPPDEDHWLYELFEEERPEGMELFRQPGARSANAENLRNLEHCWWRPTEARSDEERDAMWAQAIARHRAGEHESPCRCYYRRIVAGANEDWIRVYVDGEYGFVRDGKVIFPEYRDSMHCQPVQPGGGEIVLGMDFGLTPAIVFLQRDPRDGQFQAFREFVTEDLGAVTIAYEVARTLKAEYPHRPVRGWGDPAGSQRSQVDERTPFDVVNAAGLPIHPAPTNDFVLRREAVAGLFTRLTTLGRPALVVDPACRVLRKALGGGYCFQRLQVSGEERYRDAPLKNEYSHIAEALQYACVGEGEDRRAVNRGAPLRHRAPQVRRAFGS